MLNFNNPLIFYTQHGQRRDIRFIFKILCDICDKVIHLILVHAHTVLFKCAQRYPIWPRYEPLDIYKYFYQINFPIE